MPGPPLGPSERITKMSPALIWPPIMLAMASSSDSKTRAGPVILGFFTPLILATAPSVARLPFKIAKWPCAYRGLSQWRMTSWLAGGMAGMSFKFSSTVLPVMVMQSPCSKPRAKSIFITCGIPPTRCRSVATYFPEGFKSHSTGTRPRISSKSSIRKWTSAAWAMASKCSTALVDPPTAMVTAMAFSNALRVMIWRGSNWL